MLTLSINLAVWLPLIWRWSQSYRGKTLASIVRGSIALFPVAIIVLILLFSPDGHPDPSTSPVQHRFVGASEFSRFTPANVFPEAEQVNLGFLLMPYLDPILTHQQTHEISTFTLDIYEQMEANEHYSELGSVMGFAYDEVFRGAVETGHYYLHLPNTSRSDEPLPVLLFLHGSAGNFKSYTWVWSQFAEDHKLALIVPSYGFGNWGRAESTDHILPILEDAQQVASIDLSRIYLAGLSNGGLGVSKLAYDMPNRWQGLIFISPVMDTDRTDSEVFQQSWAGRAVFIATGTADNRIPLQYVRNRVAILEEGGVEVDYIEYEGEDHFLFFSQSDHIFQELSEWLATGPPLKLGISGLLTS